MKKIFLSIMFIFIVAMMLSASVTYKANGDGTYSAVITYKSDIYQANIIGSFINWQKPGVPMVKNADGVWEYTVLIDAPMIKYKFFDPAISDDSAYLDDPEAREKIANPFGSFDYLIRKKDAIALTGGGAAGGAPVDLEEEFNPVFGMWSMLYYNFQLYGDFGAKVIRDANGNFVKMTQIGGEKDKDGNWKSDYVASYKRYDAATNSIIDVIDEPIVDGEIGFLKNANSAWRFVGENGTTEDDYTRLILGRDSFSISSTLKFHGKVTKHFQVDVEVNSQLYWINANERWVWQGGADNDEKKKNREEWWKRRITSNVSNFVSGLFGGVGREYVFPKQYFHNDAVGIDAGNEDGGRGSSFLGSDLDAGSMHVDQVQVCWTTDNFDIYVAPAGGKNFYTKDPMSLVSSTRIASGNYAQSSIQAFIHPSVVKGLNFNLATTYSAATKNYSGADAKTPETARNKYQLVSALPERSEVGRYIMAADIYYDILGKNQYTIGLLYNMSALGVPGRMTVENQLKDYQGLQSFGNAVHELSLWTELKPVKGLAIKGQYAMELNTKYWDAAKSNKLNESWYDDKGSYTGYDPLTTMADYVSIGYKHSFFDISAYQAAAGSRFKGNLAEYGSMFAGYMDIWSNDYANGIDGHGDLANGQGTIGGGLKFGISPIFSNPGLLKIRVDYDIRAIGLASPTFANASYRFVQESSQSAIDGTAGEKLDMSKQWTLSNSWKPSLEVNLKLSDKMGMYIRAGAEFQLDTYFGEILIMDPDNHFINKVKDATTSVFTFREFDLRLGLTGISDVLKAFEVQYHLTFRNQTPYVYGSPIIDFDHPSKNVTMTQTYQQTQEQYDTFNNKWAFKNMYHMIGAEFKFSNDISLSAAYLLRYSRGIISAFSSTFGGNANMSGSTAEMPLTDDETYKAQYYSVPDYFSWGLAFQFKYVIPVKILKTPTLFVNLNMGWDPSAYYDPGYLETIGFNTSGTFYDYGTGADWNEHIHQFQMINLTLGLMWDF